MGGWFARGLVFAAADGSTTPTLDVGELTGDDPSEFAPSQASGGSDHAADETTVEVGGFLGKSVDLAADGSTVEFMNNAEDVPGAPVLKNNIPLQQEGDDSSLKYALSAVRKPHKADETFGTKKDFIVEGGDPVKMQDNESGQKDELQNLPAPAATDEKGGDDHEKIDENHLSVKNKLESLDAPEATNKKKPLTEFANKEAEKILKRADELRLAALSLKKQGVSSLSFIMQKGKESVIRSTSSDTLILSKLSKSTLPKGHGTSSSLSKFYLTSAEKEGPSLSPTSSRIVAKRAGVDLIMWRGSFAVPRAVMSSNPHLNEMILLLFDIYMTVNDYLKSAQELAELLQSIRGEQCAEAEGHMKDLQSVIERFRGTSKTVSKMILELDGLPLKEPACYWRKIYPLVRF